MIGTIEYEDGSGHPSNPLDELQACLDVLAEYVDQTPSDDADLYNSEFLTACWQTVELVERLIEEHETVLGLMDSLIEAERQLREAQRQATGLVIAQAGDIKNLRKP